MREEVDRNLDKCSKEAIAKLIVEQNNPDTEMAHYNADEAICTLLSDLGYEDVVREWDKVRKWYA